MKIKPPSYEHIIAEYRGGKSCVEIAEFYGVTNGVIGDILRRAMLLELNQAG